MIRFVAYIGNFFRNMDVDYYYQDFNVLFRTDKMDDYPISSAIVNVEVNKAGTFEFEIFSDHPVVSDIEPFANWVYVVEEYCDRRLHPNQWVTDKKNPVFYGRTYSVDVDSYGNKKVTCEGSMAFLQDFLKTPRAFTENYAIDFLTLFIDTFNNDNRLLRDGISSTLLANFTELTDDPNSDGSDTIVDPSVFDSDDMDTYANILDDILLKRQGGFILFHALANYINMQEQTYVDSEGILNRIYNIWTFPLYMQFRDSFGDGVGGSNPLLPYDDIESGGIYSDTRWEFIPKFQFGKNVIGFRSQPVTDKIITAIFPSGKDGLNLVGYNGYAGLYNGTVNRTGVLIDTDLAAKYGIRVQRVDFGTAETQYDLLRYSMIWFNKHSSSRLIGKSNYTITGPEPLEMDMGDTFIQLMRDVIFIPTADGLAEESPSYPCLSMKLDCFNPANNEYTIGPYVADIYKETRLTDDMRWWNY